MLSRRYACAVKGAGPLRVQVPPGNWFAPPGSNRSGGGGNETVGASGVEGHVGDLASMQAVTCHLGPKRPAKAHENHCERRAECRAEYSGSSEVDHLLDKPRLLTCLTRSVRSGANKWALHSPVGEQRQPATVVHVSCG